nr:hypothetical protein CFP56_21167 [Quercus suber]
MIIRVIEYALQLMYQSVIVCYKFTVPFSGGFTSPSLVSDDSGLAIPNLAYQSKGRQTDKGIQGVKVKGLWTGVYATTAKKSGSGIGTNLTFDTVQDRHGHRSHWFCNTQLDTFHHACLTSARYIHGQSQMILSMRCCSSSFARSFCSSLNLENLHTRRYS